MSLCKTSHSIASIAENAMSRRQTMLDNWRQDGTNDVVSDRRLDITGVHPTFSLPKSKTPYDRRESGGKIEKGLRHPTRGTTRFQIAQD